MASRAEQFKKTRIQHHFESAEDYTELVSDLIASKGEARTCDIAKEMGISHVTAVRTIQRLMRDGYLKTAPHKPVELTVKGNELAMFSKARHEVLRQFFRKLGVPENIIAEDVEGIEHHISPTTLKAIQDHLAKL